jgi:anti-sigma factor RsiW
LLVRAADDSLDASGRARLDAHMLTCETCRYALDSQRTAHVLLANAFDVDAPLGFTSRVVAHLEPGRSWLDRFDFRRWTWRVSPLAAGLMLAAGIVASGGQTTSASPAIFVVNAADTGVEPTAVRLSDAVGETDLVSRMWYAETSG